MLQLALCFLKTTGSHDLSQVSTLRLCISSVSRSMNIRGSYFRTQLLLPTTSSLLTLMRYTSSFSYCERWLKSLSGVWSGSPLLSILLSFSTLQYILMVGSQSPPFEGMRSVTGWASSFLDAQKRNSLALVVRFLGLQTPIQSGARPTESRGFIGAQQSINKLTHPLRWVMVGPAWVLDGKIKIFYYRKMEKGRESRKCRKVGPYLLLKQIGHGSSSKVYEARRGMKGPFYAVKQMSLVNITAKRLERIHQEINVLSLLKHPNIVQLVDFKQSADNIYLVFELCKFTDLATHIDHSYDGVLPEERAREVMCKLRDAFRQVKRHNVVHRDLKLANVLVTDDFEIKLADFGFAKLLQADECSQSWIGTPMTRAPQIFEHKPYNDKCDIWSLGVMAYQMIMGASPFFKNKEHMKLSEITAAYRSKLQFHRPISQPAKDMIRRMLVVDPKQRMSFGEFFQHPWLATSPLSNQLSQVLKREALRSQLDKTMSRSSRCLQQRQYLMDNCQNVMAYSYIEFIKSYLENSLASWVNIAKKVMDAKVPNRRLSFLALALLLKNMDEVLSQNTQVLLNANRVIRMPTYMELRQLQTWPMSEFSDLLPNLIAKSRRSIEQYLQGEGAVKFSSSEGAGQLWQLFIREIKREVEEGDRASLKIFLKVRSWPRQQICINVHSGSLTDSALQILVRNFKLKAEYHELCRKCSSLFRFTVVSEPTEFELQLGRLRGLLLDQ